MGSVKTLETEVCILGGGPAGMVLGNLLHEQNVPCIVVEKLDPESIKAEGRAGIIEWTTVAALQQHGLAKQMLSDHRTQGQCEFRTPKWTFMLDYANLNGGKVHTVYPQTDLVYDLSNVFEQRNGQALYRVEGQSIEQSTDGVTINCVQADGEQLTIHASFLVGCDGGRGLSKRSIPKEAARVYHQAHNIHWIAILAQTKPYFPYTIYAMHPDGMAAFLMRNDLVCRYYLQIEGDDDLENWNENRIWTTLEQRFFMGNKNLHRGAIFKKNKMSLHSLVTDPMRYQRIFLAGDAAHLIPPTGAKGMNLAIHDVLVLAELLIDHHHGKIDSGDLDLYSQIRLPLIWKAQNFSLQLMNMIHKHPSDFDQELWMSKMKQLENSSTFATNFSVDYVGVL